MYQNDKAISSVGPRRGLDRAEAAALAARGLVDPIFFNKTFLPSWFPGDVPPLHKGISAVLSRQCAFLEGDPDLDWVVENFVWHEDPTDERSPVHSVFVWEDGVLKMRLGRNCLLLIPRGFAKTTLLNANNLRDIVYQNCRFPMYVSKTGPHAVRQLMSISRHLTGPRIKEVFGDLKPKQRELGLRWSESEGFIQTVSGVSMVAVGRGAQVRGMLDDGKRPDRVNIDDLEDQESTKTDARREDTRDWFWSDLMGVMNEMDKSSTVSMLSNFTHPDCLAARMLRDPDWTVVKFGVRDRAGAPLWPALMDETKIDRKKRAMARNGKLDRYYMEYENTVRASENQKFTADYFVYESCAPELLAQRAIALDPAISKRSDADRAVIAVGGRRADGRIQVLEIWTRLGPTPREIVDAYFELMMRFGLHKTPTLDKFGVEAISYQAALVHMLQEEMFRRKVYFEITPQKHSEKKELRIEGILQPRYANGRMVHSRHFGRLETNLLDWPNGKKDEPDAVAMMVALLDDTSFIGAGADYTKDEFEPLEKIFGGDWRAN